MSGGIHRNTQIVRDEDFRGCAEVFEHADVAADPVWQGLAPGRFGIGVVGRAHHANKDLHLTDLARVPIRDGHRLPAIIHEAFFTRQVFLAHDGIELA